MRSGPIVIAYDGSPAAEHALREGGELLTGRPALVLTVYKQGLGFELLELPTATIGLPPAQLDIRTALEIDRTMAQRAQRVAQHGAELARRYGFRDAEGLAVADDVDVPVADTILRVAGERDAQAVLLATHGKGALPLIGSTARDVIRHAACPVVVVRDEQRE